MADLTRLEKAASDNGFDIKKSNGKDWISFESSKVSLKIWLMNKEGDGLAFAFSQLSLMDELSELGDRFHEDLPDGSVGGILVEGLRELYLVIKRAFQLSRSLPNAIVDEYKKQINNVLGGTEVERIVRQRIGQDLFRERLLDYWDFRCAVTDLGEPSLLRASHIKPWADCSSDEERLNAFNGILLAPNLDLAFDKGFVSFDQVGSILFTQHLNAEDRSSLGLNSGMRLRKVTEGHKEFLAYHRKHVFKG